MKKLFITVCVLLTGLAVQAQKFNIESALIELNRGSLQEAKDYIDKAATNESTSNNIKMWYVRGQVYLAITQNADILKTYPDAGVTAVKSFIDCIKLDKENRRPSYRDAEEKMLQSVVPAYNYAIQEYQDGGNLLESDPAAAKAKIKNAVDAWEVVIGAYAYDSNRQLETAMNLPKNNMFQLMADAAIKMGDNERAFKLFNDVIASESPVPYAYTRSALLHMELGDTAKALEVIEAGKVRFPEEKDLTTLQLMVYQNQGKEDLLTDKITEALESDPGNPILLANRGNLYDTRARNTVEELKKEVEHSYKLHKDMRKEPNAKKKAEMKKQVEESDAKVQTLLNKVNHLDSLAINDYKAAYESNPDAFDVLFNLGAIYSNGAIPLIEMANNLPADGNYDKNYTKLKDEWTELYKSSLEWFLKAEELRPDDNQVLMSIQQIYAQLGNQEKAIEYKNKREGN
ncbi:MAG: tetratricopeptide repeat protein [Bacteroidetes bacterium]|nr:tetratricopeptide repeat protein [Bacteroidota bacterium]